MANGGLIAALVGAGGALAFVAYQRTKAKAAEPPASTGGGDKCAPLASINHEAYLACKAAGGLGSIVSAVVEAIQGEGMYQKVNRVNRELNGPTKIEMPPIPGQVTGWSLAGPTISSQTLEHTNGCRPFWAWEDCHNNEPTGSGLGDGTCRPAGVRHDDPTRPMRRKLVGMPGSEKCAPGTLQGLFQAANLDRYGIYGRSHPLEERSIELYASHMFKGTARDPTTGYEHGSKDNAWWVKGERKTCPPGQVLSPWSKLRDATGNPFCTPPDGSGWHQNPNAATGGGTAVSTGAQGTRGPRTCTTGPFGVLVCIEDEPDAPRAGGGVAVSDSYTPPPR